jgi:hypothetical protein
VTGEGPPDSLYVERTGGYGGLTRRASVSLSELSPAERRAVEECLQRPPSPPSGPDRFVYRFRAHGREARVQEDLVPEELQPLLERLFTVWT